MSDISNENTTGKGLSISYESIAKGRIRTKVKIWVDHLNIDETVKQSVELYEKALTELRSKGFKVEGDGE